MTANRKDILWRVYLLYGSILVFAAIIIFKLFHIQLVEKPGLMEMVNEQSLKYFEIEAIRGNIYAADGSFLATSVPMFEIRMDVASPHISDEFFNTNVTALAEKLSLLFQDKTAYDYKNHLIRERKKGSRYFLIKRNVTYAQLKQLKDFPIFERGQYRGGLIAIRKTKRVKPYQLLAARTIGYDRKDANYQIGIEGAFSAYLSGVNGRQLKQKISHGVYKPLYDENDIEPQNGYDVITSIDVNIQDVAETSLYNHLVHHQAEWGCAILMEVQTGKIKAIANLELDTASGKYYESYNHAIGTRIEPGSTFKLASMMALLEDHKIDLEDTIDIGQGYTMFHGLTIKDVHGIRDGKISIREAFEKSSNVGISKLIHQHYASTPDRFLKHLQHFSLDEIVGIEIKGEKQPYIKNIQDDSWSAVSLPFMSIGYEVLLTPIQILSFYNAIANNGKLVKPMLVSEVREAGKTIQQFDTEVLNNHLCSEETLTHVKDLLEGVVERGTATFLNRSVYKIAGKTGTAQIAQLNTGYDKTNYNASFVGYFPAENPQFSCIVVVSKPKGAYYASSVAVPVFKSIADKVYATRFDIHFHDEQNIEEPDLPLFAIGNKEDMIAILSNCEIPTDSVLPSSEWMVTLAGNQQLKFGNRIITDQSIPNVIGMGAKNAIFILERMGLTVNLSGKGQVKEQIPAAGTPLRENSKIILKLGV